MHSIMHSIILVSHFEDNQRGWLPFLNLEVCSSLQVSTISDCVFQYARLSLFLKQGVLRDFNILLCLTHKSGSTPVLSSAGISPTSDTVEILQSLHDSFHPVTHF